MAMQLILTQDVPNLGKAGELVSVRPGYGRNFLVPNGYAVTATVHNKNRLDHEKAAVVVGELVEGRLRLDHGRHRQGQAHALSDEEDLDQADEGRPQEDEARQGQHHGQP